MTVRVAQPHSEQCRILSARYNRQRDDFARNRNFDSLTSLAIECLCQEQLRGSLFELGLREPRAAHLVGVGVLATHGSRNLEFAEIEPRVAGKLRISSRHHQLLKQTVGFSVVALGKAARIGTVKYVTSDSVAIWYRSKGFEATYSLAIDDSNGPKLNSSDGVADWETVQELPPATHPERTLQEVLLRRGQSKFRQQLLDAYSHRCAITGSSVAEVLEAAHVEPYHATGSFELENGVLLRGDIHTLYDLCLIGINPSSLRVEAHPSIQDSEYAGLHMQSVREPADGVSQLHRYYLSQASRRRPWMTK